MAKHLEEKCQKDIFIGSPNLRILPKRSNLVIEVSVSEIRVRFFVLSTPIIAELTPATKQPFESAVQNWGNRPGRRLKSGSVEARSLKDGLRRPFVLEGVGPPSAQSAPEPEFIQRLLPRIRCPKLEHARLSRALTPPWRVCAPGELPGDLHQSFEFRTRQNRLRDTGACFYTLLCACDCLFVTGVKDKALQGR